MGQYTDFVKIAKPSLNAIAKKEVLFVGFTDKYAEAVRFSMASEEKNSAIKSTDKNTFLIKYKWTG